MRLRSYHTPDGSDFRPTILEAALATTAAPTYFSEVKIRGTSFVDGAIGANNPAAEVEREARELWCQDGEFLQPLVKCFISIGTGHKGVQSISDKGLKHLIKALEREATQTDVTHQNFLENWRRHGDVNRYFRFNVDYGLDKISLAEYKEQDQIQAASVSYMEKHDVKGEFRGCVSNLRLKQCKSCRFTFRKQIELTAIPDHVESDAIRQSIKDTTERNKRKQASPQSLNATRAEICKFLQSESFKR